jgi:hypothetical protein
MATPLSVLHLQSACKPRVRDALVPSNCAIRPGLQHVARRLLITIRKHAGTMMSIMKAPEFTGYWFDDDVAPMRVPGDEESTLAEQEALDDLAERVSAARSVI